MATSFWLLWLTFVSLHYNHKQMQNVAYFGAEGFVSQPQSIQPIQQPQEQQTNNEYLLQVKDFQLNHNKIVKENLASKNVENGNHEEIVEKSQRYLLHDQRDGSGGGGGGGAAAGEVEEKPGQQFQFRKRQPFINNGYKGKFQQLQKQLHLQKQQQQKLDEKLGNNLRELQRKLQLEQLKGNRNSVTNEETTIEQPVNEVQQQANVPLEFDLNLNLRKNRPANPITMRKPQKDNSKDLPKDTQKHEDSLIKGNTLGLHSKEVNNVTVPKAFTLEKPLGVTERLVAGDIPDKDLPTKSNQKYAKYPYSSEDLLNNFKENLEKNFGTDFTITRGNRDDESDTEEEEEENEHEEEIKGRIVQLENTTYKTLTPDFNSSSSPLLSSTTWEMFDKSNGSSSIAGHDNSTGNFSPNLNSTLGTGSKMKGNQGHFTGHRRHIVTEKLQYTKEITIKQGQLMGIVRNFHPSIGLRAVDQYLGIPYAEAPVGSRRFMPPGAALPWQGLKIARHLPAVCPQKLPDTSSEGSFKISPGRLDHLLRLRQYLKHESEDCLYLNIYVPRQDGLESFNLLPVLVYIHGESFEWNSGNPYDGSTLASYGQVIVVTVNYRLGIFGFLRPGLSENTIANYGLLDQIAALHWIKENIHSFGGDKEKVTLMGHSQGAACINYLMVSPVASGLFHRAILMSGSAMSDWAVSNHSLEITQIIAQTLDCPLTDDNEQMLECLREKRYQDLLKLPTSYPQHSTSLGPIVDGHVIPNQPYKAMGQFPDQFGRYDLLFGVTEAESYHLLSASVLDEGLTENERDAILRFYMQNRFDVRPDLALAATMQKYNDMYNNPIKATNLEHRDVVLDILSDAQVVGPLIQTGLFHAEVNRHSFMYVFGHNSAAGPHASLPHSIAGEELAFIFGAPLAPSGPFLNNYSVQEKLLSEAVMTYWTNFAKTGNPKAPWRNSFLNLHAMEWDRYDIEWPEFNKKSQTYLNIGIPPSIGYKYRQIYMNFWNKELPDDLNQIAALQFQPFLHTTAPFRKQTENLHPTTAIQSNIVFTPKTTRLGSEIIAGHMNKFGSREGHEEDPVRTLKLLLQEPYQGGKITDGTDTAENMYNAPPTFGIPKKSEDEIFGSHTVPTYYQSTVKQQNLNTNMKNDNNLKNIYASNGENGRHFIAMKGDEEKGLSASDEHLNESTETPIAKSETTLYLLIGLIFVFIILNIIIYTTFIVQKKKKTQKMNRKLGNILTYDGNTDDELKRSNKSAGNDHNDDNNSYLMDIVRKSNTYEAVKMDRSPINGYKITRQLSSSTIDTQTKVSEWMNGTLNRMHSLPKNKRDSLTPTLSSLNGSQRTQGTFSSNNNKKAKALDGSPQKQDSLDNRQIIICEEIPLPETDHSPDLLMLPTNHQHSKSDPVDVIYYRRAENVDEQVTSFIYEPYSPSPEINVTSLENNAYQQNQHYSTPLTQEQQLYVMQSRNYPKVLPTIHDSSETNALSMTKDMSKSLKRNSLPPTSFMSFLANRQMPPAPPPRTISTLDRKSSPGRRNSNNITTSPLKLAEDYEELEPEITQNTLIVGPIVPKANHPHNSTLKRSKTFQSSIGNEASNPFNETKNKEFSKSNELNLVQTSCSSIALSSKALPNSTPTTPGDWNPNFITSFNTTNTNSDSNTNDLNVGQNFNSNKHNQYDKTSSVKDIYAECHKNPTTKTKSNSNIPRFQTPFTNSNSNIAESTLKTFNEKDNNAGYPTKIPQLQKHPSQNSLKKSSTSLVVIGGQENHRNGDGNGDGDGVGKSFSKENKRNEKIMNKKLPNGKHLKDIKPIGFPITPIISNKSLNSNMNKSRHPIGMDHNARNSSLSSYSTSSSNSTGSSLTTTSSSSAASSSASSSDASSQYGINSTPASCCSSESSSTTSATTVRTDLPQKLNKATQ